MLKNICLSFNRTNISKNHLFRQLCIANNQLYPTRNYATISKSPKSNTVSKNAIPINTELLKFPISKIRNVGIIAHIDAGKTTTTERILYYSGSIKHIGNVDQGDTITDYLQQERDRGITIQSAAVTVPWNSHRINIIDTPGHADFTYEVIRSLRVLDGTVVILDAVEGVEAQTEKVWKQSRHALKLPNVIYINKMDRMGAGFSRTCKDIMIKLKTKIVLVNIPFFIEDEINRERIFTGVIDVINGKILIWDVENAKHSKYDGTEITVFDLNNPTNQEKYPNQFKEYCSARESMVETLCEFDHNESLVDSFLENDEDYMKVPAEDLKAAIRNSTLSNDVSAVLCGASFKNIGVQPLMDSIVDFLPSPIDVQLPEIRSKLSTDRRSKKSKKKTHINNSGDTIVETVPIKLDMIAGNIINNNPQLTVGLAFKVISDYRKQPMIFVRIYSGKLLNGAVLVNSRTGKKFRIINLFLINGDTPHSIDKLNCGNIGVMTVSLVSSATEVTSTTSDNDSGSIFNSTLDSVSFNDLNELRTGDTFVSHSMKKDGSKSFKELESKIQLNPISSPPSIFVTSLEPRTVSDKKSLDENLKIILREDPSLKVFENEEGQTLISGMGELHLEIVKDRLVNDMKTNCDISKVMVTYKETLLRSSGVVRKKDEEISVGCSSDPEDSLEIELEIEPFEGPAKEHYLFKNSAKESEYDNLVALPSDNNLVYIPLRAAPRNVSDYLESLSEEWPLQVKYDQVINSLLASCVSTLQNGGMIGNLPLNSVLIKINKWRFPKASTDLRSLLFLTRDTINETLREKFDPEKDYAILEPIMTIKVAVNNEDVGKVSHDLTSTRKAVIMSIEDDLGSIEETDGVNYLKEAEKQYLPYDQTVISKMKSGDAGKEGDEGFLKLIEAIAPLREMIGYLTKLRSLTKGRSTFVMEYKGLRKVTKDRLESVKEDMYL